MVYITMLFVQLEGIYRLWKNEEGFTIDMVESWTQRIHQMLQEQADHMEGAFDNDYAVRYLIVAFLYFLREIQIAFVELILRFSFVNVSVQAS